MVGLLEIAQLRVAVPRNRRAKPDTLETRTTADASRLRERGMCLANAPMVGTRQMRGHSIQGRHTCGTS